MAVHRTNRPLMIYTSLIFVVAIIMVILAFLGEKNLKNTQLQQTVEKQGITERASLLSEQVYAVENENSELRKSNESLKSENESLTNKNTELSNNSKQDKNLCEVFNKIENGQIDEAKAQFAEISKDSLKENYQIDFYNSIEKLLAETTPAATE